MNKRYLGGVVVAIVLCCCDGFAAPRGLAGKERTDTVALKGFSDEGAGISFQYPRTLRRLAEPDNYREGDGRFLVAFQDERVSNPDIEPLCVSVFVVHHRLTMAYVMRNFAPMGFQDIPPKSKVFAGKKFYNYGRGGGGVDYPDEFITPSKDGFVVFFSYGTWDCLGPWPTSEMLGLEKVVLSSLETR